MISRGESPGTSAGAALARTLALAVVLMTACGGGAPTIAVSDGSIGAPLADCIARPDFGGPATAADRAVFAYDAGAPLNLKKTVDSITNGVEVSTISFNSPDGGVVPAVMWTPVGRSGLRPGIVVIRAVAMQAWLEAMPLAQRGAVVISITAPYVRRGASGFTARTAQDRRDLIQHIKDLQRAVDVLLVQGNVDPARLATTGYSYGGMIGVLFAGIERRLDAAAIVAGPAGQVMLATDRTRIQNLSNESCATLSAWFQSMVPIEPIRFIPGASPVALLFQIARADTQVPLEDAQLVYDAASSPKEVLYYESGHVLPPQSDNQRFAWLVKHVGIDP